MGLKSSTLLQEGDIEELQNETGCRLKMLCPCPFSPFLKPILSLNDCLINGSIFLQFLQIRSKGFTADLQVLTNQRKGH